MVHHQFNPNEEEKDRYAQYDGVEVHTLNLITFSSAHLIQEVHFPKTFTIPSSLRTFVQISHMILYNVTVNIDDSVHDEWLQWMKEVHIPDVLKTGMFLESKICKIDGYSEGGISYAIQYLAPDQASYDRYQEEFSPALQAEHSKKYAGKFGAFRTVLQVIHHEKR